MGVSIILGPQSPLRGHPVAARRLRVGGTQDFLLGRIIALGGGPCGPTAVWASIGQPVYQRALNGLVAKGWATIEGGLTVTEQGLRAYKEAHRA